MSVVSEIPCLGEVIADRYELKSLLGQGGMGLVYAAWDVQLGRAVAIKILWANAAFARADARARFQREARVTSALRHPGAVEIFHFGADEDRLFIVMELLEGESLAHHLWSNGALEIDEVISVGYDVADVLSAAHALPAVHRDLKPANVFLDLSRGEERTVVLDFGLAFVLDPDDSAAGRLTRDSRTLGTPFYMSPEQACDVGLGPASDIYSLGCMLCELLTGKPPFHGGGPAKILAQHLRAPPPSMSERRADAPAELDGLIARMLAKQPHERPTAEEVCTALAQQAPTLLGERDRRRARTVTIGRAGQSADPSASAAEPGAQQLRRATRLAILGKRYDYLLVALGVHGIDATSYARVADLPTELPNAAPDTIEAVFALFAEPRDIAALRPRSIPIIAEAATGDIERITALRSAGATAVVSRPVQADELARQVKRAVRNARARGS